MIIVRVIMYVVVAAVFLSCVVRVCCCVRHCDLLKLIFG